MYLPTSTPEPVSGSSSARHSTCDVIGKASNARNVAQPPAAVQRLPGRPGRGWPGRTRGRPRSAAAGAAPRPSSPRRDQRAADRATTTSGRKSSPSSRSGVDPAALDPRPRLIGKVAGRIGHRLARRTRSRAPARWRPRRQPGRPSAVPRRRRGRAPPRPGVARRPSSTAAAKVLSASGCTCQKPAALTSRARSPNRCVQPLRAADHLDPVRRPAATRLPARAGSVREHSDLGAVAGGSLDAGHARRRLRRRWPRPGTPSGQVATGSIVVRPVPVQADPAVAADREQHAGAPAEQPARQFLDAVQFDLEAGQAARTARARRRL